MSLPPRLNFLFENRRLSELIQENDLSEDSIKLQINDDEINLELQETPIGKLLSREAIKTLHKISPEERQQIDLGEAGKKLLESIKNRIVNFIDALITKATTEKFQLKEGYIEKKQIQEEGSEETKTRYKIVYLDQMIEIDFKDEDLENKDAYEVFIGNRKEDKFREYEGPFIIQKKDEAST
jgi:arginyl-tRNA--protein-N-Asp/Glu arginylyltransferase